LAVVAGSAGSVPGLISDSVSPERRVRGI
jgi:hypothetical protein